MRIRISLKNIKIHNHKQILLIRKSIKVRNLRAAQGFDQSPLPRRRSLRPIWVQAAKVRGGRIKAHTFQVVGTACNRRLGYLRPLVLCNSQYTRAVLSRKYRLKLRSVLQYQLRPAFLKLRPASRLRHQRQLVAQAAVCRRRIFSSNLLHAQHFALQVRTAHAPCVPPTPRYRRRARVLRDVILPWRRAMRRYRYSARPDRRQPEALLSTASRSTPARYRVVAARYRATRLDFTGFSLSYQRRWWWNKKWKKLRRKCRRKVRQHMSSRYGKKQHRERSKWLRRRRSRGRRLFAGMFGSRRWRAERRDRFFLRRERRQECVRRLMVYKSTQHVTSRKLAAARELQKLYNASSSNIRPGPRIAVVPVAQRVRLQKHKYLLYRRQKVLPKVRRCKYLLDNFRKVSTKARVRLYCTYRRRQRRRWPKKKRCTVLLYNFRKLARTRHHKYLPRGLPKSPQSIRGQRDLRGTTPIAVPYSPLSDNAVRRLPLWTRLRLLPYLNRRLSRLKGQLSHFRRLPRQRGRFIPQLMRRLSHPSRQLSSLQQRIYGLERHLSRSERRVSRRNRRRSRSTLCSWGRYHASIRRELYRRRQQRSRVQQHLSRLQHRLSYFRRRISGSKSFIYYSKRRISRETRRIFYLSCSSSRKYRRVLRLSARFRQSALHLRKLSLQRHLHNSLLTAPLKPGRRVTQVPRRLRNRRANLLHSKLLSLRVSSRPATGGLRFKTTALQRIVYLRSVKRTAIHTQKDRLRSFLQRRVKQALCGRNCAAAQSTFSTAFSKLARQGRRYRELRFYHKRPRVRLPKMEVTRRRRRKGGLVTFVQNSLKRPQTLAGRQNLLLPPNVVYTGVTSTHTLRKISNMRNVLAIANKPDDSWPLFWRRPHTRANIKAINAIRRRQYSRRKRRYSQRHKRWARRMRIALHSPWRVCKTLFTAPKSKVLSISAQDRLLRSTAAARLQTRLDWAAPESLDSEVRAARLFPHKRHKQVSLPCRKVRVPASVRRTMRRPTPMISRTTERNLLTSRRIRADSQLLVGLWQARSVKSMLLAERALSAWSPQLSIRNRRAHFPRVQGVPVRRRTLSFTAKRARRNFNAKLLARNIPQRRYTDYAPIKLQHHYGSVGSVGYVRFRRVYRPHSKHNRWWRPNKAAVPFAHPFSRRSLTAKRYLRTDFSLKRAPRYKAFSRVMQNRRAAFLHSKYPPRPIPWRNFRFARPRWGRAPKTLHRWTFVKRHGRVGQARAGATRLVLGRTAREIRALEEYTFSRGVWKGRRWNLLDTVALRGDTESHLFAAIRCIPQTVWQALRQRTDGAAAYTLLQRRILDEFRRWARKEQKSSGHFAPVVARRARLFLINLLTIMLHMDLKQINSVVHEMRQHYILRSAALNKKVELKAANFLKLRMLPQLGHTLYTANILQRERSALYRRWLQGVEGAVKRPQLGYIPTSRSRYTTNVAIMVGRYRPRFPASGRRRKSYDSLLHAFAKKVAPARFRRNFTTQFKRVMPPAAFDFRENLLTTVSPAELTRRKAGARIIQKVSYLSAPWRELLHYGGVKGQAVASLNSVISGTKRRFLSLPLTAVTSNRAQYILRTSSAYRHPMRVIRAGILRKALRRRREERAFLDLRHSTLHRRLPKEQASRPWKLRRAIKRWRAMKRGPYSSFTVQRRAAVPGQWTLVHLGAVGPQPELLELSPLPGVLSSGERIAPVRDALRREKRDFRGIVLPVNAPQRRKLRRKVRGATNRKRVSRRPNLAGRRVALRNTKHWSEKRDQDFCTATLRHKRFLLSKRVSRALSGKTSTRAITAFAGLRPHKKINTSRFTRFLVSKQFAIISKKRQSAHTKPITNMLVQRSSFNRNNRRSITSHSKLVQLRRHSYYAPQHLEHKGVLERAKFGFRSAREGAAVSERLVATVGLKEPVTALWFQRPATRVVKSEKTKENDVLADIAEKEGRYKLTAQYTESLTAFLPELMNHMLLKKIESGAQQLRYKTAQHLIRNIYWSLRVYLNVDPFDTRFFVRDKTPAARVRLFECISDLSEFQVTEQPQRAALRYRFQPSRVLRAPNTMRFRGDWLRAFFPAKHALYQENPRDYRKFLLKTRLIRRLRIGPRGVGTWITQQQPISHETRARQILSLRFSRKRRRFETVLQTTRRTPEPENTTDLVLCGLRSHFFSRQFSTYAGRRLVGVSRWIHRQKRFIGLETGWRVFPPTAQVSARSRAVSHLEHRAQTSYVATDRPALSNTLLDLRFARARSPRSRQYLIRMNKRLHSLNRTNTFKSLILYRKVLDGRVASLLPMVGNWADSKRRTAAIALRSGWAKDNQASSCVMRVAHHAARVGTARTLRPTRIGCKQRPAQSRTAALLYQSTSTLPREAVFAVGAFWRYKLLWRRWNLYRRSHQRYKIRKKEWNAYKRRVLRYKKRRRQAESVYRKIVRWSKVRKNSYYREVILRCEKTTPLLESAYRQILRRNKKRSKIAEVAAKLMRQNKERSKKAKAAYRQILRRNKKRSKIAEAVYKRVERNKEIGEIAEAAVDFIQGCKRRWKKVEEFVYWRRTQRYKIKEKKWNLYRKSLPRATTVVRLSENKPSLPRKLLRHSRLSSTTIRPIRITQQGRQGQVRFFKKELSRGIFRALDFARSCALYTRFYRQAPFDAHRPRLWDSLTQRWMKKYRIGRYWLRDTSRWLRDPWLSEIVACDAALRPDRFGGELRARPQQVGQYVADVDSQGRNIVRKGALRERHKFQKILPAINDPEIKKTNKVLKKGSRLDRSLARHRLRISRQAFRKPMPGIRLANYEFRDAIREHKVNKAKSTKQKKEEEELRVKAYWARKAKKLPPIRPKRLPLKYPANLWLPHIIWKEIQRRIRKFEWRESDEVFFRRGFRTAFQFYPNERQKAPWLEPLIYTRAAYSTRLREFRRRQYPHEQKKFKWLQRVRRLLYPGRNAWYIKGRRWPQLRRYNQKLHYSLFNLRDRSAARRHFKTLNGRTRPNVSGFVSMSKGLTDRLDLTCLQLGFAPSIYWARIVSEFGLLRVNGTTVFDPAYQIKPNDVIYPNWDVVARFQHYFKPQLRAREEHLRLNRASTSFYPTNMEYHRGIRAFVYKHAPDECDLRRSSRIFAPYFRWFKLDSV